jgi:hypothetical protein
MFGHFWDKIRGRLDDDGFILTVMNTALPATGNIAPVIQLVKDEDD